MSGEHVPVMLQEVIEHLRPRSGGRYVDGTLGAGGHAEAILEASSPDGELLGTDWDQAACERAGHRLEGFGARVHVRRSALGDLPAALAAEGWDRVDGVFVDLGLSSVQLDDARRGLSFSRSGPLDMRLDSSREGGVGEWLESVDERELAQVIRRYGEEPQARRIAEAILAAHRSGDLPDTLALAAVVERTVKGKPRNHHPATRTFQALRIALNGELEQLEAFLADGWERLAPGGRMVVLAYHSLEDRLVKRAFRKWALECLCPRAIPECRCGWSRKVVPITRRALRPTDEEVARNPRARSARLRAVERVAA